MMLKAAVVFATLLAFGAAIDCERKGVKFGCIKKNSTVFPDALANNRDPSSRVYTGEMIDWGQFSDSLHSLACACEEKAVAGGYKYYAIGFYGECDGGKDEGVFDEYTSSARSLTELCFSNDFMDCIKEESGECTGAENTVYAYKLSQEEGSGGSGDINGGGLIV